LGARKPIVVSFAVSFLCFVLLAWWANSGRSLGFDLWLRAAVHTFASPALTSAMLVVTTLGSELFLLPLGAMVVWRLTATGRRRQAIVLAAVSLGAEVTCQLLKVAFQRPRPAVFFGLPPAQTYSFPSGHAFVSTVFYGLLAGILLSRGKRGPIVVIVALLIGLSRVYLGYHYPSDVLGGWALAIITVITGTGYITSKLVLRISV
jgi:undecaprenyl-diphosphatase